MAGVSLRTISELMGHKTIQMTMRYAHLAPGHNRAAVDRLVQCRAEPASESPTDTVSGTKPESHDDQTLAMVKQVICFVMVGLKGGRVAQLVEQCPFKAWVAGSNPAALTMIFKHLRFCPALSLGPNWGQ